MFSSLAFGYGSACIYCFLFLEVDSRGPFCSVFLFYCWCWRKWPVGYMGTDSMALGTKMIKHQASSISIKH